MSSRGPGGMRTSASALRADRRSGAWVSTAKAVHLHGGVTVGDVVAAARWVGGWEDLARQGRVGMLAAAALPCAPSGPAARSSGPRGPFTAVSPNLTVREKGPRPWSSLRVVPPAACHRVGHPHQQMPFPLLLMIARPAARPLHSPWHRLLSHTPCSLAAPQVSPESPSWPALQLAVARPSGRPSTRPTPFPMHVCQCHPNAPRKPPPHLSFHSMSVLSVSSPFFRFSWYFCGWGVKTQEAAGTQIQGKRASATTGAPCRYPVPAVTRP